MFESSCIELSRAALRKNIRFLKRQFGPKVIFSSVVKGNAYGHGLDVFVPLAESCGIRHFSVANAEEALKVYRSITKKSDIMIMGCVDGEALEWAIVNQISFYVFNLERLNEAVRLSRRLNIPARIHLEFETGMNRTGLEREELLEGIETIRNNYEYLRLEGVCTHYAGAESIANYKRIRDQIGEFQNMCEIVVSHDLQTGIRHTAASAAALTYPETRMDMVRIGIAQYGFWPSKEAEIYLALQSEDYKKHRHRDQLRRVLRWRSRVMSIKEVDKGEFVGYGNHYLTTRPLKVAAVPIGYFHGFRRSLGNIGRVLIHGRRVGIIGNVNMSMILINVSEIKNVAIGDEVVIIGKQKKTQITVGSFSDMSNLVNYEMLVRLPSEIPRVVVD